MEREIEETALPGVGMRYSFETESGERVSVLLHHSGHREVFVSDPDDPDRSREVLDLDERDSRVLAELLGGARIVHEIHTLQQDVEGVAIDWLLVEGGSAAAGQTIGQLEVRSATGVTVIAVIREGQAMPGPGPEFELAGGDTAVVIGPPEACRRAKDLFRA